MLERKNATENGGIKKSKPWRRNKVIDGIILTHTSENTNTLLEHLSVGKCLQAD